MTPNPAHVADLVVAAGKAGGLLQALEHLVPHLAEKIGPVRKELNRSAWAVMGRPAPETMEGETK